MRSILAPRGSAATWRIAALLALLGALLVLERRFAPGVTIAAEVLNATGAFPEPLNFVLPATVAELAKERPQSLRTDYGLLEKHGESDVMFFADRGGGSEPVPDDARIRFVHAEWTAPDDDSASRVWERHRVRISRALASSGTCFRKTGNDRPIRLVRWEIADGGYAMIRLHYEYSGQNISGSYRASARVEVSIGLDSSTLRTVMPNLQREACP